MSLTAIELFTGAGGLAMGVTLAGFQTLAAVEWNRAACSTLRHNQRLGFPLVASWPLTESDVRELDWSAFTQDLDLLAGGPPCQPFSLGGKHQAHGDCRDMFPATVEIVRKLRPKAFVFENVKGLTRSSFANYYQYILLQLEFPELSRRQSENWFDHLMRLQAQKAAGTHHAGQLRYGVVPTLVNAADYGVPQKRERVFLVGFRSDLDIEWHFPTPTHSEDSLLRDQWITGNYWKRHRIQAPLPHPATQASSVRLQRLAQTSLLGHAKPWRTVRDAIADLPDPEHTVSKANANHNFQGCARAYPGHTGSPLDLPAKAIKAGDHGVPGGENMLVRPDGSVRYFTARETARLQTFPDGYSFDGSWTETMRQLGNAVPVRLGQVVASSVAQALAEAGLRSHANPSNAWKVAA